MLSIKSLHAGYGGAEVLRGVDAQVGAGEIVAFIGPNGAGKSTLLKSVYGLCDVYSGKIEFKGRNLRGLPTYDLVREGIGFVPQGRQVFSDLTVRENLDVAGYALPSEVAVKGVEAVLDEFAFLRERLGSRAWELSGGQQQLLAMASALVAGPELLLLDEPSLGLAPKAFKQVFGKIEEIRDGGTAVALVEQNARVAVALADKTYVLVEGSVALQGGKELLRGKGFAKAFLGG
ncbi:hypothetical protein AUJ14_03580 [Candidatus Micrarchaeota archaeon CG1_02_55_22]|nr:MAG: hypothetical protein AUJ14_03580 [Candidatus Micrarchaeota archaeon CG1_02_55_22]